MDNFLNKVKGWKTILAALVMALGNYLGTQYPDLNLPATNDWQFYAAVVIFLVLRFITTSPVFKSE